MDSGHVDCAIWIVDSGGHKSLLTDNVGHSGGANIVPYQAISPSIDMPTSSLPPTQDKTNSHLHIFCCFHSANHLEWRLVMTMWLSAF